MRQGAVPPAAGATPAGTRARVPLWLKVLLSTALLFVIVWFVVVPQFAGVEAALASLESVSLPLVLLAAALQLSSLLSFSALTAAVLGPVRPGYFTLLRIDLADLGVNHVVPGGGATAAAVRFRLLVRAGVRSGAALTTATIETTGSNLVLGIVFAGGILLSITTLVVTGTYIVAGTVVLVLLVGTGAGVWFLTRRTELVVRGSRRVAARMPLVSEDRVEVFVRSVAAQVLELVTDRRRMSAALGLAGANWLLDAASLGVLLAAFGHPLAIGPLLAVYGLGGLLALLPLTPGGLGIVEGVLVPALVAVGTPHATALLAVVGWRVLEFWLPIPLGLAAYVSLRLGVLRRRPAAP
ncbi:YbhN family protein [Cryobacterium sp. 5I3]|uniref:lysylphosphatidylglycerol synthase transmembrane domain-containing protein n=1 Tax=Cryobacterium sp. 5I3 TaxID=3048592 RepID=UPI002B230011|nr:YbhN family protein [Cryobacterium sp. 5I3]MEB0202175.1 YbhN family protein [Cryobacterium sp. 5I3]